MKREAHGTKCLCCTRLLDEVRSTQQHGVFTSVVLRQCDDGRHTDQYSTSGHTLH